MKKITKLISLFCLAAVFVLASCSSSTSGGGVTYIGSKAPTEPKEVGDIVFNDGSATPYAEIQVRTTKSKITDAEKAAAIAVIFYVGNELNDEEDTTVRTLGVGIGLAGEKMWCAYDKNYPQKSANACDEVVETIFCNPQKSATYEYIFPNDMYTPNRNGKDNLSKIGTWLQENNKTDDTGEPEKYPAFYACKNYSTPATKNTKYDEDGWYLPTLAELYYALKKIECINDVLQYCGQPKLNKIDIWTSSLNYKFSLNGAVYFEAGKNNSFHSKEINELCFVLPIREF